MNEKKTDTIGERAATPPFQTMRAATYIFIAGLGGNWELASTSARAFTPEDLKRAADALDLIAAMPADVAEQELTDAIERGFSVDGKTAEENLDDTLGTGR